MKVLSHFYAVMTIAGAGAIAAIAPVEQAHAIDQETCYEVTEGIPDQLKADLAQENQNYIVIPINRTSKEVNQPYIFTSTPDGGTSNFFMKDGKGNLCAYVEGQLTYANQTDTIGRSNDFGKIRREGPGKNNPCSPPPDEFNENSCISWPEFIETERNGGDIRNEVALQLAYDDNDNERFLTLTMEFNEPYKSSQLWSLALTSANGSTIYVNESIGVAVKKFDNLDRRP